MHSQTYLAAACALLSAVAAQPAPGMDTVTHIDYVTEMVTSTVWVDASDPRANQTPAPVASASKAQHDVQSEHQSHSHGGAHSHGHESSSSIHVAASAPAAAPSSSSVVAPPPPPPAATSSTSVVAPAPVPAETHATTPTTVAPPPVAPTTSTQAPPPAAPTTSTQAPPPAAPTTSTPAANIPAQQAPASSSPAAAETTAASSGSGKHYNNAKLTFYGPEGGLGSCGSAIANTDIAVAISAADMDKATMCGKMIQIELPNHPTIQAKVVDTCPGCPEGGLDLTSSNTIADGAETGAWAKMKLSNALGPQYGATWYFI